MRATSIVVIAILAAGSARAADHVIAGELKRYLRDGRGMAAAPLHWSRRQWMHFGEGAAAVAVVYAADGPLHDAVQRNRSSFSDDFAKAVTPFGGHRAMEMSFALIAAGVLTHDPRMRDAGRDSLESELLAAGVITPLLKRGFGRARPSQDEGSHSFQAFSSKHQSFPSGHATNAFAFATAVAGHYDNWIVPTIVYAMASGVAISRVNDRAHFPSDVLAGALIGRAVGRSIVSRHRHTKTVWTIVPTVIGDRAGLMVHVVTR